MSLKRSRPVVNYVESESDENVDEDFVANDEDTSDEDEDFVANDEDASDEDASDESVCSEEEEEEYEEDDLSDSDLVEEKFETEAERIRDQLMRDQGYYYTTFDETLTRDNVLRALRFVRNMGENHHCISTPVATRLTQKLTAKYHLEKLTEEGGVPIAFKRKDTVCTLFALLLEHVIQKILNDRAELISSLPGGLSDALSANNIEEDDDDDQKCEQIWNEISTAMEALGPETYIKRCVGGAVAYLVKYPEKIDQNLHKYFDVYRGMENSDGKRQFRILGANTRAPLDEKNNNRLVIPIYSDADAKPTYICAHVPIGLKMKDLLETCKRKYPNVKKELGDRTFTVVFSPYASKFGHSPDDPILRFVTVPPDYKLPTQTRDRRGMICAIEGNPQELLEPQMKEIRLSLPGRAEVQRFTVVIRDTKEPVPRVLNLLGGDMISYLRLHHGLKITGHIPGFKKKTYVVCRNITTERTLKKREETLKNKLEKCVKWIAEYSEDFKNRFGNKLPWPGSVKAQKSFHASIEARIAFYPYNYNFEVAERENKIFATRWIRECAETI